MLTIGEEKIDDVPEWQQDIVRSRFEEIIIIPDMAMTENEFQLKMQQIRK